MLEMELERQLDAARGKYLFDQSDLNGAEYLLALKSERPCLWRG